MIKISNGTKKFKEKTIFENIDLTLHPGEVTGIIGRNGSGKTVLFKCILGFYRLSEGKIEVDDLILGKDIDILKDVGAIIETPGYLGDLTGYQNLELLYTIRNTKNKKHIDDTLKRVGLDCSNKIKVKNYSLGMKQRLAIAQCIMENPKIIILDEPMNGLDSSGVSEIRALIQDLKKENKIIVLASHSKEDIDILCDKVFRIEDKHLELVRQNYSSIRKV